MSGAPLYDRQGRQISLEQFSNLMSDHEYRYIVQDRLDDGWFLSTVWLGIDHSFGGDVPLIFETMLFDDQGHDQHMVRWPTEAIAIAGHDQILADIKAHKRTGKPSP